MDFETITTFIVTSALYIVIPGSAVVLAVTNGLSGGTKVVLFSTLGHITGLFLNASLVLFGISLFLQLFPWVYTAITLLGCMYLIYLGVMKIVHKDNVVSEMQEASASPLIGVGQKYSEGFLLSVTNPKPMVFFISMFPQFLRTENSAAPQLLTMTVIFMAISFLSLMSYGMIANTARILLRNTDALIKINVISGLAFIALGFIFLYIQVLH